MNTKPSRTDAASRQPDYGPILRRIAAIATLVGMALLVALLTAGAVRGAQGDVTRVSVSSNATQGDLDSMVCDSGLSGDGRYIAFSSEASNLVPGDTNGQPDVFVRDQQTGQTTRVSVSSSGDQGNGTSAHFEVPCPRISTDGRFVAFASEADNLVAGDTNAALDVFVHDRQTGDTTRVSVSSGGGEGNDLSAMPAISNDGRYVAFASWADNLVAGDSNTTLDVFVHDRQTGDTTRVSVASNGTEGNDTHLFPAISGTGRFVVFESQSDNLVANDTNGLEDVFVHDRQTGQTRRVSVSTNGDQGNDWSFTPTISANGRYVVFTSDATNFVANDTNGQEDVFVHDLQSGETSRVSVDSSGDEGDSGAIGWSISTSGRHVVFESDATNLVADDTNGQSDVFVHDLQTGETARVSVAGDGSEADLDSYSGAVSADGRYVGYVSDATNLVSGDTNGFRDVFVYQYLADPPTSTTSTTTSTTQPTTTSTTAPTTTTTPPSTGDYFTDDDGHTFEGDIDWLYSQGITKGCNPPANDHYCPDDPVTRGQMSAFLVRALGYTDNGGGDLFNDDDGHTFENDIDKLGTAGVTKGCNPPANDRFCPDDPVTRGQMAAFLRRALTGP